MNVDELSSIEQLESFLAGTQAVVFEVLSAKDDRYQWIQKTLIKFDYPTLCKRDKGIVQRFMSRVTGYSRQQLTRLIKQYRKKGKLIRRQKTTHGFKRRYTPEDIILLAKLDERHDTLNGFTTKKLCERAFHLYGNQSYKNLANISVSHLYNLRKSRSYRERRQTYEKTKSKCSPLGERRKPQPYGKPGYIRVDTVHQGDQDGQKGVYHINAVDEVTQFEIICSVEKISEQYLIPILSFLIDAFPFVIIEFHSDNGSEYINKNVVKLLEKLHIELTKSRARHCNDNALVEGKNGAIVRKILGYSHIPQRYASVVNDFNQTYLNPYINYHRPCFFPQTITDENGKQRKTYPYKDMATPYEKFKSLERAEQYLKAGIVFADLDKIVHQLTDDEAAEQLQQARKQLFSRIQQQEKMLA